MHGHVFSLAGYYMYIEASSPRTKGHKAWLQSPLYKATTGKCLQFWYHMYGSSIGRLNVLLKVSNIRGSAIWTMSGNLGNAWRIGQVTVKSSAAFRVSSEILIFILLYI